MNRRGFITAILAAPLAALGSFAGNRNITGSWVELGASAKPYYDAVKDYKGPVAIWSTYVKQKADWVLIEFADGKLLRHQKYPGIQLPVVSIGDEIYETELSAGDLC